MSLNRIPCFGIPETKEKKNLKGSFYKADQAASQWYIRMYIYRVPKPSRQTKNLPLQSKKNEHFFYRGKNELEHQKCNFLQRNYDQNSTHSCDFSFKYQFIFY